MKQKKGLHHYFGLRAVAVFEFVKGSIVLLFGLGLLSLVGSDVQDAAETILRTLHLDPAWHYSQKFVEKASTLTDVNIRRLAVFAFAYAAFRIVEAYGLWYEYLWAEWLAVVSAGLYMPFEVYHLWVHITLMRICVFVGNLAIVAYLAYVIWDNHRQRLAARAAAVENGTKPAVADIPR